MEGERYASDSAAESLAFAAQVFASGEGGARQAWVFDVDETLLSDAPYYAISGWGGTQASAELLLSPQSSQYIGPSSATPRPGTGISSILAYGQPSDIGNTAMHYKSERRTAVEAEGFNMHGSSGDQWSDLIGLPMAMRSFKLPNPMYFIS